MTFITSDLHFYHKNIIKYTNRPYDFSDEGVAKMNEDILKLFDDLPPESTIINNGDLALSSKIDFDDLKGLTDRMKENGKRLIIVLGNHDREITRYCKHLKHFKNSFYLFQELGFDRVYDRPIIFNDRFVLSHEPIYLFPKSNLINLYGHTHDKILDRDTFGSLEISYSNYYNVCFDYHHAFLNIENLEKLSVL